MSDIIYGRRKTDNKIISIDEVPVNMKGLLCDCVCAHCGKDLQACSLEGKVSRYFRHHNESHKDIECDCISNCNPIIANETALHKMAKQIIADEKRVIIPGKSISLFEAGVNDLPIEIKNSIPSFEFHKAKLLCAESVELEKRLENFSPDILLKTKKGEVIVEIFVSHRVDFDKEIKAKEYGSAMLEIDLSEFAQTPISSDKLREIIIDTSSNRKWIFYPLTEDAIFKAKYYFENNKLVKQYRKSILEANKKRQRDENNRKLRNEKIKHLFKAETYESKLRELRDDHSFLQFYKTKSKPFWFSFDKYYIKYKCVPFFVDIPISGEMIFQCDRRIWQSVIFNRYVYGRKSVGGRFNIESIYDVLRNEYGIAVDYDLSYKLINPLDENRFIWLRKEVIDNYINYLEILGFITLREDGQYNKEGIWALADVIKTIDPPRKRAAEYLKLAIKSVNQYSPDINHLIDEKLGEYQEIIDQEKNEDRRRKIIEEKEKYEVQVIARAKQEEEERQRQKQREMDEIKAKYNDGFHDVESFDFSLPTSRYDRYGYRWARCNICNCIKREDELATYKFGIGECNQCRKER